jgi:hypothetical protein
MAYITKKSKKPEMLGDVGFTLDEKPEYIKKKEKKNWITKKKKNWITKKSKNIDKFFGDIEF